MGIPSFRGEELRYSICRTSQQGEQRAKRRHELLDNAGRTTAMHGKCDKVQ